MSRLKGAEKKFPRGWQGPRRLPADVGLSCHNSEFVKKHNPNAAVVKVRYKCEGTGFHLWASLKQGPGVRHYEPTPERPYPPADVARAWYETPEGVVPTCDGTYNTLRYTVSRVAEGTETHPEAWGRLRRGKAFAQFVVFSFPEGANPETDEPNREAFAGVVRVAKPHHHHHHHH